MALEDIRVGYEARLMIGASTYCFAKFVNESTREIIMNPDTICGDIDHPYWRVRKGRKIIRGSLFIDPTPVIMENLIPWLGLTANGGGVYSMGAADALTENNVKVDLETAQHDLSNCVCLGWAFRGSKGGRPCQLQIDISGEDETQAGGPFADNPVAIEKMYVFTDISTRQIDNAGGTLTARPIDRFLIQVDNRVVDEWNSSITRTGAKIGDRRGVFATSVPYITGHEDLYWTARDSEGPVEAKLKVTNSDGAIEFFMPNCVPITKGPSVLGKADQIRTPVTMNLCRGYSGGNRVSPMTITLT